ncbi:hypothetical protein DEO72_LG6g2009 [Vigna unguiculata]|uniref:Uncharacterized protein n=1 Tax=Vigna unguiculata TaxID=3917 RepID=A0A4D6M7E6_VIGUN|nr:hypothetical protein DEO72_LG6g2009 [Vigna unguiculata]
MQIHKRRQPRLISSRASPFFTLWLGHEEIYLDVVQMMYPRVPHKEDEQGIDNDGGGFPGGPYDTSLLTWYEDHVARMIWDGQERQLGETGYKFRFTSLRHGLCNPFGKTKFWFLFDVQVFGLSDKTSMQIRSGNLNEISDSILFLRRGHHHKVSKDRSITTRPKAIAFSQGATLFT